MAIEVSLHLHGTPYGELGWGQHPVADLAAADIRSYAQRLADRMNAVAAVMDRLYADGWTSQAQSYELAFTKAGIDSPSAARSALERLGIDLEAEFLTIQEPVALGGESSADTYRFYKVVRAQPQGMGWARGGEWVTPSAFAPEMVGLETLLPVHRAVVIEIPEGLTAMQFAEEAWGCAHGGSEVPPIDPSFVDMVFEYLASVEDLAAGAEVGFQHEHEGCCGHEQEGCEHEP